MDNAHIAFVTLPHSPHVNPTLPIVSALMRRGNYVTYATSERFSAAVESLGAEVVPCQRFEFDAPSEDSFSDYTTRMLESITPFFEKNRPSLILYDFMALAGRILANRWSIPAIQTSPFYAFHEDDSFESQVEHIEFRNVQVEHGRIMAQFLRRYGVASSNYRVDKEKLNIYLFPRVLQPNSARFGNNCFFAGRCAAERLPTGQWQDNTDGRPIALIAMSTLLSVIKRNVSVPEYFKMCIDALPGLGWHVVLAIGERCNAEALAPLPAHCEIIQHTSYLRVLPRAKLLVFMSGIASTAEAAFHGVPMVAISEGVGEYEWQADHIVELGIGAHIRKGDTNAENIRKAAIQLSGDVGTLHKLKEIQRSVRGEPGGEDAANRIEVYLNEGR